MATTLEPALLSGISVYQDVTLAGQTVLRGARDCPGRWEVLAPHLPLAGTILDVGSNFGWFGLKLCQRSADCVVASVEADPRSAAVQRRVLQSHQHHRMALLTRRADVRMMNTFARAGQTFDAALCLSILHWLPDHREFLARLGTITSTLLIEQPHPKEAGAGIERVRREIGSIGPYLAKLFPDRPVEQLAELPGHRGSPYLREIWKVGQASDRPYASSPGLEASALLELARSWPPRSWWQQQLGDLPAEAEGYVRFTPYGLEISASSGELPSSIMRLARRLNRIPEYEAFTLRERWYRRSRHAVGRLLRGLKVLR